MLTREIIANHTLSFLLFSGTVWVLGILLFRRKKKASKPSEIEAFRSIFCCSPEEGERGPVIATLAALRAQFSLSGIMDNPAPSIRERVETFRRANNLARQFGFPHYDLDADQLIGD